MNRAVEMSDECEHSQKQGVAWKHFRHDADIGLCGTGAEKARAFEAIGLALTAVITDLEKVAARESIEVRCKAPTDELLLVDWLNSLIYEMAVRKMLFRRFEVSIEHGELSARVIGEPVDVAKHQPAVEVKGATYTSLALERKGENWIARCVVDV